MSRPSSGGRLRPRRRGADRVGRRRQASTVPISPFPASVPSPGGTLDADRPSRRISMRGKVPSCSPACPISATTRPLPRALPAAISTSPPTASICSALTASKLAARGRWDAESLAFEQLAADEWGGASFTLSGALALANSQPVVTGGGRLIVEDSAARRGAALCLFPARGRAGNPDPSCPQSADERRYRPVGARRDRGAGARDVRPGRRRRPSSSASISGRASLPTSAARWGSG